ncbi:MAG: ABC transporter permease [Syntrophothermus sp.]
MFAFLKLAARNIMRHKRRNMLTGLMICVGTVTMILTLAYGQSVERGLSNAVIQTITGNIQIHAAGEQKIEVLNPQDDEASMLASEDRVRALVAQERGVAAVAPRLRFGALLSTGEESAGVAVLAVDPMLEAKVSPRLKVAQGSYLTKDNGILLGKRIARTLNIGIGDELILLANNPDGYLNALNLEVQGIVAAEGMEMFLGNMVYITIAAGRKLLYLPEDEAYEVVVALKEGTSEKAVIEKLRQKFDAEGLKLRVDSWKDLASVICSIMMVNKTLPLMFLAILLLVVAVGIINTVMMSVLERTREIGTMMALGTTRKQVLGIFLLETGVLSAIAAGTGLMIGAAIIFWLSRTGIPAVVEAMEFSFGGKRLYLVFDWPGLLASFAAIILLSVLAALFSARRVARLKPVEALHSN